MKNFRITSSVSSLLADTLTPVGAFLRLRRHFPGSILLESSDYQRAENSFSYICCSPIASVCADNEGLSQTFPDGSREQHPLEALDCEKRDRARVILENFLRRFEHSDECALPPGVINGVFGFLSFDAVALMEDITLRARSVPSCEVPLLHYRLFRYVLAFDHFRNKLYLLETSCEPGVRGPAKNLLALAQDAGLRGEGFQAEAGLRSNLTDDEHAERIRAAKKSILRGDVFQIVLSRRFTRSFTGDDFQVYRALRSINPSPYLFYFEGEGYRIFGSSPEAQLVIQKGSASIRPIAGTYKRTGDDTLDAQAVQQLLADPKESAEHVMLVDLARNDLSIHCHPVEVETFREVQIYSHVIHLVSKVTGKLLPGSSSLSVLTSTFPAGTLSGAPKFRALELIDGLEQSRRHAYGGALGFIGFDGAVNHAITIRSFVSKDGQLHCQAGSGIVADSDPEREVQEIHNKLAALMSAVEQAKEIPV